MFKILGTSQSNQVSKLTAAIEAARTLPNYCKLTIVTNSKYVIEGLTSTSKTGKTRMDRNKKHETLQMSSLPPKEKNGTHIFEWVKGHKGDLDNKESEKLAKEGAKQMNSPWTSQTNLTCKEPGLTN